MSETVRRLRSCVENWPDCEEGEYDPRCCRFPKSCSCEVYDPETISEEKLEPVTEPANGSGVEWSGERAADEAVMRVAEMFQPAATLDDVVPLLSRIADALEAQVRPAACGEVHKTGGVCVLNDRHVGHHATGDGRLHWLDEE